MKTYAILDATHEKYELALAEQRRAFKKDHRPGGVQFVPILNLAGTEALIRTFTPFSPEAFEAVIAHDDDDLPRRRDMAEWEKPLNL